MKNLILHIGYPRTGTTWLQKNFFPKVKNFDILKNPHPIIFGQKELKSFPENFIVSHEEIINVRLNNRKLKEPCHLKPFIDKITSKYNNVTFFVIIRKQTDIITSAYSYRLATTGKISFAEYLSQIKKNNKINQWAYYSHLKNFEECYGIKLKIFLFEDFIYNNKAFSEHLSKELGFEIDINSIKYNKKNESKGKITRNLIHLTKYIGGDYASNLVYRILPNIGKKFSMPEPYRTEIFEYFKEENEKLDKEYNLGLKKYKYY